MDKQSRFLGFICIVLAFFLMFQNNDKNLVIDTKESEVVVNKQNSEAALQALANDGVESNLSDKEEIIELENDLIFVKFSTFGGAIKSVSLKNFTIDQDRSDLIAINDGYKFPALGLSIDNIPNLTELSSYNVVSKTKTSIKFRRIISKDMAIFREYVLNKKDTKDSDSYIIKHTTSIHNHSDQLLNIGNLKLNIGAIPNTESDITGDYLNFGYFDGKDAEFVKLRTFKESKGFLGFGKRSTRDRISETKKIVWGSVKNQFFSAVLTPNVEIIGYETYPVSILDSIFDKTDEGIAASLKFDGKTIEAGKEYKLSADFYVGPKDFKRLDRIGQDQDKVMQFGFFGTISKILLFIMLGLHSLIPNWGVTIIVLTVIVKLCLWPLTTAQVVSSKKMAMLQQPMKDIKERFKNNPQKSQTEIMKLFKLNRVNPAAGFLSIFIQIPIFLGLYYMLRTASDLRFAHFLWIKDLSLADTVCKFGKFPVNILPFIMLGTMMLQMKMTPMPNAESSQKLFMKIMPAIFLLCCYSFPSGLVLYWTVQNLLTITQQIIISRRSDMNFTPITLADTSAKGKKKFKNRKSDVRA